MSTLALLMGLALAAEGDGEGTPEVEVGETITNKTPEQRITAAQEDLVLPDVAGDPSARRTGDRPYPDAVYTGATALSMEPEFVGEAWVGTRLIFSRRYKDAKRYWDEMEGRWPGRGIQHVGSVLIYQSMMMENFDFRFEKQYLYHSNAAIEQLTRALQTPGNEAWEHFLIGMMMGVESVHIMRREDFVPAFTRGVEAMRELELVRQLAPDFVDSRLGDGLFKYWRSVISINSKVLPDGADQRAEGIADLKLVEKQGVFMGPGATLGLAFVYIEERDLKAALAYCQRNHRAYPDNVINNLVLSRVHMYLRDYDSSVSVLKEILADAPDNQRAYYYLATVYVRKRNYAEAEAAIDRYLAFDLSPEYRAQGLHRKGDLYYRKRDWDNAARCYTEAVKLADYKPSKLRLERIAELRKQEAARKPGG